MTVDFPAPAGPEDPARADATRLLFARPWVFLTGAADMSKLPPTFGVEVAFAGRSNVGKSSLINAVLGQQGLARTSNTPGRTQMLNFFVPGVPDDTSLKRAKATSGAPRDGSADIGLGLVDMPGYGFAQAPKADVEAWTRLVFDYLRGRQNLRRIYVLIDSRHGLKSIDTEALDILDKAAVSYQVVLTKADKIVRALDARPLADLIAATGDALRKRPAAHPIVLATSSEKGWGIDTLRDEMAALAL